MPAPAVRKARESKVRLGRGASLEGWRGPAAPKKSAIKSRQKSRQAADRAAVRSLHSLPAAGAQRQSLTVGSCTSTSSSGSVQESSTGRCFFFAGSGFLVISS